MKTSVVEASYPLSFREKDSIALGEQIKNGNSVVMIGMKRVGISNFLRFFLNHPDIQKKFIGDGKKHLFIPIDLNDLIEREIYPFWVLTHKRILDAVEKNKLPEEIRKQIENLFMSSIQLQDHFMTLDNIRKSILILIEANFFPTIFFLRYDRLKDVVTADFFNNLQGLIASTHHNLTYVFTSVRDLHELSPSIFTKSQIHAFAHKLFVKPASHQDAEIIFESSNNKNKLKISEELKKELLRASDGYAQYLMYAQIVLVERKINLPKPNELFALLLNDERIALQSEELWESLTTDEKDTLIKMLNGTKLTKEEKLSSGYLWETGIFNEKQDIFSPLFSSYLQEKIRDLQKTNNKVDLTRKEHLFLNLMLSKKGDVCERDEIIKNVWPETEALGVSDWAIDRLVARLRNKLKQQNSQYEIVTVKTRGYKIA